jgi:hypothetical protein
MVLVDGYWWTVVLAGILIGLSGIILGQPFFLMRGDTLESFHRTFIGLTVVQIFTAGFWSAGETLLFLVLERIKTSAAGFETPTDISSPNV